MTMMASAPARTEDPAVQSPSASASAAVGHAVASASPPRRLIDRIWYRFSVRAQLLLTFIAIGLVASLVAGAVTVLQARKSTRLEIAASLRMAEILVGETTELLQQELSADQFLINLPAQLRSVRHLRVTVRDMSGAPVSSDVAEARTDGRAPAPAWFAALIAPPVVTRELPVVTKGERIGSVLLAGEASDEISEVWENTVDFALVSLLVGFAAIGALHVLLGRVLDPLTALSAGLVDLEQRNYRVRLARPKALELAAITDRFNSLAQALDALRGDNARLNRRLITAQDDERRHTALELHDEVGPSLFGLKANATSIANAVGQSSDARLSALRERASEMLAIVDHLQSVNRSMLNRLRPMALGHVPLADLVSEIVRERARQHPVIAFRFAAGTLPPSYGEPVDLTVYRCMQEGLTNAIRHAGATRIEAELCERHGDREAAPWLELVVRDNGCGFAATTAMGRGLLGMQERVHALAGSCALEGGAGQGALLRITIPLPARSRDNVRAMDNAR
jgi:two-component system, NarL family, sensor histidine kinase UhpB